MTQPTVKAGDGARRETPARDPAGGLTAAEWAALEVAAVRDDPAGRMALLARTYREAHNGARRYERFRRAAMSFMRWQAERGVLRRVDADPPGSRWWRAINERLLLDCCEATARARGRGGAPSSHTIEPWLAFVARPTARSWYRAHNASVVTAYLEHRTLAEAESEAERFFCNVALLRVLYAHALVAAPRLALGRLAALGPLLGDPRGGAAGAFLSLRRVLPDRYPLEDEVATYLALEHRLGRTLDYGLIVPRIQTLYEWSARELAAPGLRALARDGRPMYAWPYAQHAVWNLSRPPLLIRGLRRATRSRGIRD